MNAEPWRRHLPDEHPDDLDLLAQSSLPDAWVHRWNADPAKESIHDPDAGWVTAGRLEERSRVVAGRLLGSGLVRGDRVLMSCASSIDLVIAHAACLRAGLVVVPANIAYRRDELAHVAVDAEIAAAIVDEPDRGGWINDVAPEARILGPSIDLPDAEIELRSVGSDEPALIGYTSGTTGRPKGAVLDHGNLLASSEAIRLAWRWTSTDRLVLCLPLFHMHGLGVGLHGTLLAGASAVLLPRFDVDEVLDAAAKHRATLFFGVPTMYARLVESPRADELARLRLCVSGSAPLPASLHERFEAASGQKVLERYGMTETAMLVSNPHDGERKPGTVGLPLPGLDLRLDPETNEILVRGPNVFSGYRNRPEANQEAFTDDGYFRTGDLGAVDDDGYVTINGRAKELVISGGYNVYPREVEDVLRSHPAVIDAAVTGTPDEEWGEIVTAWLETSEAVAEDDIKTLCAERLADYKRPRIINTIATLPRNALGKVQKHLL